MPHLSPRQAPATLDLTAIGRPPRHASRLVHLWRYCPCIATCS